MSARLIFLDRDLDPGWRRAWDIIAGWFGDLACEEPRSGEVWQYMGSAIDGEGGHHEFRHRMLPEALCVRALAPPAGVGVSTNDLRDWSAWKLGPTRVYVWVSIKPGDFAPVAPPAELTRGDVLA